MKNLNICYSTIESLSPLIAQKKVSPVEITQAFLERIDSLDRHLNAYITVIADTAMTEAQRCEREIMAGQYRSPLHGIPIALKDLYDTVGIRTTAASKIFAERVPEKDAGAVARLKAAGAIILGKCNLHEFAYGVTGTSSFFGPIRNPWDLRRIPGGSSGGSGAAVAAHLCMAATGSDTGGSIRIPSALCGIVGLKPTFGRVSCHGMIPLSWSLDHAGPMTKSVFDAAVMLQVMSGWDPPDPASSKKSIPNYIAGLKGDLTGLKLAIDTEYTLNGISEEVKTAFQEALKVLENLGMQLVEVALPGATDGLDAAITILMSEATAYHEEWLKTRPQDYQPDVRDRLMRGFPFRGIDYGRARLRQTQLIREYELFFEQIDLIATPMCGIPATLIDTTETTIGGEQVPVMTPLTRFTRLFNLTGLPAISVPCGFSGEGLPIGLQLIGRAWDEPTVLQTAHAYEKATLWSSHHSEAVKKLVLSR